MVYILNNSIKISSKKDLTIFLDMDDVIVNWLGGACKVLDTDLDNISETIRNKIKNGERNVFAEIIDEKEMWEKINKAGEDFWANLEKFPWTDILLENLPSMCKDFMILTRPSRHPSSYSGKVMWIHKHLGEDFENIGMMKLKEKCAAPNAILIDDSIDNIRQFEKNGGHTFLWPSSLSFLDKDKDVNDVLNDLVKKLNSI